MKWYKIPIACKPDKPFIKKVKAGNKNICLVNFEGDIFALASKCPHAGGDLSEGWCINKKLVCPVHRYSYDLTTGKGSGGQHDFIEKFQVKIADDAVYIGVSSFWEKLKEAFK